ncbi:hypothetical protein VNO78_10606 [Psophocarpus tetragonolobus]|uniref:Uncharacterized protein n=1 Tax=Psophocarpus tetragonolobus TaxID=3891 RepID=A0AAN9SRP6_PSOTE
MTSLLCVNVVDDLKPNLGHVLGSLWTSDSPNGPTQRPFMKVATNIHSSRSQILIMALLKHARYLFRVLSDLYLMLNSSATEGGFCLFVENWVTKSLMKSSKRVTVWSSNELSQSMADLFRFGSPLSSNASILGTRKWGEQARHQSPARKTESRAGGRRPGSSVGWWPTMHQSVLRDCVPPPWGLVRAPPWPFGKLPAYLPAIDLELLQRLADKMTVIHYPSHDMRDLGLCDRACYESRGVGLHKKCETWLYSLRGQIVIQPNPECDEWFICGLNPYSYW